MSLPVSFEFFPPRDAESRQSLVDNVAGRLAQFSPEFFSVTYGAGGSTRDGTADTVLALQQAGHTAAPHLSIGADQRCDIHALLDRYQAAGIKRIVALRGDVPSGMGKNPGHNAETLVGWIRDHSKDAFHLEVAAYPEVHPDAPSPKADLEFFKRKIDAGANSAITQYFYSPYAFEDFVNRARRAGITVPIVPGVMPLTNYESILRFSRNCGADVPRWLERNLAERSDDQKALTDFGVEVVTRLCRDLIDMGAPALHFYTLNRYGATSRICDNLDLGTQPHSSTRQASR